MKHTHRTEALEHLEAVRTYNDAIRSLEEAGATHQAADLRRANAEIGVALKMAEVHALLFVGDQVAAALEQREPRPVTLDQRLGLDEAAIRRVCQVRPEAGANYLEQE